MWYVPIFAGWYIWSETTFCWLCNKRFTVIYNLANLFNQCQKAVSKGGFHHHRFLTGFWLVLVFLPFFGNLWKRGRKTFVPSFLALFGRGFSCPFCPYRDLRQAAICRLSLTLHLKSRRALRSNQRSAGAWFCQSSCIIIRQDLLQEQEQNISQNSVASRGTRYSAWTGSSATRGASGKTEAPVRTEVTIIILENEHAYSSYASWTMQTMEFLLPNQQYLAKFWTVWTLLLIRDITALKFGPIASALTEYSALTGAPDWTGGSTWTGGSVWTGGPALTEAPESGRSLCFWSCRCSWTCRIGKKPLRPISALYPTFSPLHLHNLRSDLRKAIHSIFLVRDAVIYLPRLDPYFFQNLA